MPDAIPDGSDPEMPSRLPANEPLLELTLGRSRPAPEHPTPHTLSPLGLGDDSRILASDCRAKAEAARWAAERQRRIRDRDAHPEDDAPADLESREWAEILTDAYYWASSGDPRGSTDPTTLDDVGGCFETLAEAIDLLSANESRKRWLDKALPLVAEAQSALRRSLQRLGVRDDPDQLAAYELVRATAARHRIFLKRYLRADDLADPETWPDLLARIEAHSGSGALSRRQQALMDKLRASCATFNTQRNLESWRGIIDAVEQLMTEGTSPSNREIRGSLLAVLDDLPQEIELPRGFTLVLREIDRFLATRPTPQVVGSAPEPTEEVRRAAELLAGRSVVLIGGIRRPQAQDVLRSALGLRELIWIGTKEHQSIQGFEAAIARPEVALVLLAIRWSSHAFGDVRQFCEEHGKPLVRLPAGYNPAQVASQIVSQCSNQLGH